MKNVGLVVVLLVSGLSLATGNAEAAVTVGVDYFTPASGDKTAGQELFVEGSFDYYLAPGDGNKSVQTKLTYKYNGGNVPGSPGTFTGTLFDAAPYHNAYGLGIGYTPPPGGVTAELEAIVQQVTVGTANRTYSIVYP